VARIAASQTLVVKRTPLDLPIVAFLASAALSLMFAENQNVALFGSYARYDVLLTMFTFAALFWLSVPWLADQADARMLIRVLLAGRGRRHCRCCRQPEEAASSARPAGAGIRGAGAGAGRRLLPRWLRAAGAQSGRPDADGLRSEQDRRIEIRDLDRFGAPDRQPAGAWLRAGQRGSCLPAVSDRRLG